MQDTPLQIYTDGACSGNPGPGGWGAVIQLPNGSVEELSGGMTHTTNNRMELMAAIEALKFTQDMKGAIHLFTDSMYVRDGIDLWLPKWKTNGWLTSQKKEVKNVDLWQQLDQLRTGRTIEWNWVRGHAGHPENERADLLARNAIVQQLMQAEVS